MNSSELLHKIAKQRIAGLETVDDYQLKPIRMQVTDAKFAINLNNDIYILNTRSLPVGLSKLDMLSSDNVFQTTKDEYDLMDEYRYQTFADYLEIFTTQEGGFTPFYLEFVRIIPYRKN